MKHRIIKLILLVTAVFCLLLTACGKDKQDATAPVAGETTVPMEQEATRTTEPGETDGQKLMPWEVEGAKQPEEYTLEEYEALSDEERKAFMKFLGSAAFAAWEEKAEADAYGDLPWNEVGAKQPRDYTWEEYQALSEMQQKAFLEALGPLGLEAWLDKQGLKEGKNPWDQAGAKQPKDYTWAEYQALTKEEQAAFLKKLGHAGFQEWLARVQGKPQVAVNPWEKNGAKQPQDYTWEEYEALTSTQKKAFRAYLGTKGYEEWLQKIQEAEYPWNQPNGKKPEDYTWEEYEALSDEEKIGFQRYLGLDGFDAWLDSLQPEERYPWDEPGAKQPQNYTWAEFLALPPEQQMAFQNYLGEDAFSAWMEKAQEQMENYPWNAPGAKQPKDYTLEEFENLTGDQQIAFQKHLGTAGFEAWLKKVQSESGKNPWELPNAKQPGDYTWAEFSALTADQQIAFQKYLGTAGFEAWMKKAQSEAGKNPWELPGAKQPKDYTWAEFEALTGNQQIAFQNYLGAAGFEAWMEKALSEAGKNPWELPGAKQPKDYTWAEFEALTGSQQIAFQEYLGAAGFEAWMEKAQSQMGLNPWEIPGAKQPEDYTWEEFEALTGSQQIAFQNYMGIDAFVAWMERVLGL